MTTADAKIIYLEHPGYPELLGRSALKVVSESLEFSFVTSVDAAVAILANTQNVLALLSNIPDFHLFESARRANVVTILLTDQAMEHYSLALRDQEESLVDHIIAARHQGDATAQDLFATIRKLVSNDLFGIEKYLALGTHVYQIQVTHSGDREIYNNQVMRFAEECRLGSHIAKAIWGISEEMLMNAIYDAPSAAGRTKFEGLPRTTKIELSENEQAQIRYGCDGDVFALSVCDPFGMLKKEKLFEYLKKVLRRHDSKKLIDTKVGGAGLGLFKILYNCHALIVNVEPGVRSEIIALIDSNEPLRDFSKMPRTIHYFSTTYKGTQHG